MARDARVDSYIDQAAPFAQPLLRHLRELVHATVPDLGETLKWGMPHFTHKGKNLAGCGAFKEHAAFMIHGDGRQDEGMGQFGKIKALSDLPSDAEIKARLLAARDRLDLPIKKKAAPTTKAKADIAVPDDFLTALSPKAQSFFDEFAPSYRREYLEWVTGAKRAETRMKRIAQAAEWLAEGKKMGWKYEGC